MLVVPQSLQSNENRSSATLARNVHTVPVSHHKVPKCPNIRNALAVVSNTRTNVNFEALTFKVSISDCSAVTTTSTELQSVKAHEISLTEECVIRAVLPRGSLSAAAVLCDVEQAARIRSARRSIMFT